MRPWPILPRIRRRGAWRPEEHQRGSDHGWQAEGKLFFDCKVAALAVCGRHRLGNGKRPGRERDRGHGDSLRAVVTQHIRDGIVYPGIRAARPSQALHQSAGAGQLVAWHVTGRPSGSPGAVPGDRRRTVIRRAHDGARHILVRFAVGSPAAGKCRPQPLFQNRSPLHEHPARRARPRTRCGRNSPRAAGHSAPAAHVVATATAGPPR